MLFGDAEREYRNLKKQFAAGQLSEADFRARLENMMIEDGQGKWWSIGYETGKWYYHDGEQWVRGDPPTDKSTTTPTAGTGAAPDGAVVTRSAATDVPGASSTGAPAEPSGSAPGNLAAASALGAAATPATTSAGASVASSRDASTQAPGANAPAAAPGRRKSLLTAVIGALVVMVLAAGAYIVLSRQFMVMSKSEIPVPTADAGSGQAGGGAMVMTAPSEGSPTTVAVVALLPTETPAPTDTSSPASVPPTDTATPEAPTAAPSATLVPPTETPVPDTPTPEPPTPTPVPPTATPAPTATRRPAPTATRLPPTAQPAVVSAPAVPGLVTGFEQFGRWLIGNQPYGAFTQATQERHSGSASARLDYNFPAVNDNYVVFSARPPLSIPGAPTALSIWVLGDGSGHFLNAWVQDSQGEVRAFHFGAVTAAGTWQKLTAPLDTTAPWPQGHISGPDNGKLDYPIKLFALVLDGVPDGTASQGTIYLDDIMTATASNASAGPEPAPSATP